MTMKKYLILGFGILSLIFIHSCSDDEMITDPIVNEIEDEMDPDTTVTVNPGDTTITTNLGDGDSDYIFDQSRLHTFELKLSEENLAKINSDPAAEEYVEGQLIFEGDTIGPVGIRYKGSIGAFVGCLSGFNWANPSGSKRCTKLSMKIKVNWNGSDSRFYGLKKLQFHAMNLDDSQMHDRLGYWLFRQMDVKAPRCVHARLVINGEYNGLFALVEQIDGRFTRHNWDDGKGNLYKEIWPLDSDGEVQRESEFLAALKTNEDENPSVDLIKSFGEEAMNAEGDALKAVIAKWMDIDKIIAQAAVDRTIKHDDGPFHWYCNGNTCSPHNFYWYEETGAQKLHLVPWDLDNAFENITNPNAVTNIRDDWGEISNNCQPVGGGIFGLSQLSAACDQIVKGWTLYEEEYDQAKDQFKNGPFSAVSVDGKIQEWSAQIQDATAEASNKHSDAISSFTWTNALLKLQNQCAVAREN